MRPGTCLAKLAAALVARFVRRPELEGLRSIFAQILGEPDGAARPTHCCAGEVVGGTEYARGAGRDLKAAVVARGPSGRRGGGAETGFHKIWVAQCDACATILADEQTTTRPEPAQTATL